MDQAGVRMSALAVCCPVLCHGHGDRDDRLARRALFIGGFIAYPVVGALILAKVPRHDIGRLMVGVGAGWALAGVGAAAAHAAAPQVAAWLGLVESAGIVVGYLCLLLIFALFPSPGCRTPRQRLLMGTLGAVAVIGVVCELITASTEDGLPVSPLAIHSLATQVAAVQAAVGIAYLVLLAVSLMSLALRMSA